MVNGDNIMTREFNSKDCIILAYDIENPPFSPKNVLISNNIICLCVVQINGRPRFRGQDVYYHAEGFVDALVDQEHDIIVYAHHQAYDFFFIKGQLLKLGYKLEIIQVGSILMQVKAIPPKEERRWPIMFFRCSFALFRSGLGKIGKVLGLDKLEMPKNQDRGSRISWVTYCRRDAEIVKVAILNLAKQLGMKIDKFPLSTGGVGMRTFERWLPRVRGKYYKKCFWGLPADIDVRRSDLFGGHTYVYKMYSDSCYMIDVNSSYPAELSKAPVPLLYSLKNPNKQVVHQVRGDPSDVRGVLYRVNVNVQDDFPPFRFRNGKGVFHPTGMLKDILLTDEQLEYAFLMDYDVEILSTIWCEEFLDLEKYFRPLFEEKQVAKGFRRYFIKIHKMNSITGKLWERPERQFEVIDGNYDGYEDLLALSTDAEATIRQNLGKFGIGDSEYVDSQLRRVESIRWDPEEREYVVVVDELSEVKNNFLWVKMFSGNASLNIISQNKRADGAGGDTDSILIDERNINRIEGVGTDMGEWSFEKWGDGSDIYGMLYFPAPKTYLILDHELDRDNNPRVKVRAKGFSKVGVDFFRTFKSRQVRVFGPKTYMKKDMRFRYEYYDKQMKPAYKKREMIEIDESLPLRLKDINDRNFMQELEITNRSICFHARDYFFDGVRDIYPSTNVLTEYLQE
jgi:hypothetical protein